MRSLSWADCTFAELAALDRRRLIVVLPVGAIEAHGPHLPLSTDRLIALAMAEAGAVALRADGHQVLILPPIDTTAAPFAAGFPGTLSISPSTFVALLIDLGKALERQSIRYLVIANSHFDPSHVGAIREGVARLGAETQLQVAFPDLTRRALARQLTEEFQSGACHAGAYETSIVLATRPDLVDEPMRQSLAPCSISLSQAIARGQTTFEEAGGALAYFGDPAAASAEEGESTIELLGKILSDAARELLEKEEAR